MEFLQWGIWLAGAFCVVGTIEWLKGFLPKAPSWVWAFTLPLVSILVAWALAFSEGGQPWFNALGIFAMAQLGYQLIVQTVKKRLAPEQTP